MKVSFTVLLAFVAVSIFAACTTKESEYSYTPKSGCVPDAKTAIKIAIAVWEPIYGVREIAEEKPYVAMLKDGIWIVEGSLLSQDFARGIAAVGGTAEAEISQKDGRIIRISHSR